MIVENYIQSIRMNGVCHREKEINSHPPLVYWKDYEILDSDSNDVNNLGKYWKNNFLIYWQSSYRFEPFGSLQKGKIMS